MIAALPEWMNGAARDLGVVAGIVLALGAIFAKTPLGRVVAWIYKRLFGQPVSEWLARVIHGVVGPEVAALSGRNDNQHAEIEQRVAVVEANTAVHSERLDRGSERMDQIIHTLGGLQSDVAALRRRPPTSGAHT